MSIIPPISPPAMPGPAEVVYPCSDGRPVGETPVHRDNLLLTIEVLQEWFAAEPEVYVSGNMFLYYVDGDKRKHVSPDVFVVRGIPKDKPRKYYLLWEERRGPDLVIEITSESTRDEDMNKKLKLYRDVLKVPEYFLFDPYREYVEGQLNGYRLRDGEYEPIAPLAGRLASDVLGLHLEADGEDLRLYDPKTRQWLPTAREAARAAEAKAEAERKRADEQQAQARAEHERADEQQARARAEHERADEQQFQAQAERQRADEQQAQARAASERADAERKRAQEQELEIERLHREIQLLKRRPPDA